MKDFEFVSPTKIYFGKGKENETGSVLRSFFATKVLVVYGQGFALISGLLARVLNSLKQSNIEYYELSGVRPNPSSALVRDGVELAKNKKIDYILAIGGGSVIDTAKSIAMGYYYDGDAFDFNLYKLKPAKALPIGVVLTISAAGSELSNSCVIMDDQSGIKIGFNDDIIRPQFAIMNPELTYSLPPYQTACGIVDIISHSLERYFTPGEQYEFSESLALSIIKDVILHGKVVMKDPTNYDARACLMLENSFSHNGLTGLGKHYALPIHSMEHVLSAYDVNIAHGAGLALLIPCWMEAALEYDVDKFARFARDVFSLNYTNKLKSARIAIQSLRNFFKEIGMPTTLKELKLTKRDIPVLADKMTENGTRVVGQTSVKPLNRDEIVKLLTKVL